MNNEENNKRKITISQWRLFYIILLIGLLFLFYYVLKYNSLGSSAALYVGLPFLLALGLSLTPNAKTPVGVTMKWLTIALLLSVPLLREGFICIIMASPILYSLAAFFTSTIIRIKKSRNENNKIQLSALTIVIAMTALEGTHESLTFDRFGQVEYSRVANVGIGSIRDNLSQSLIPSQPRPFFLRVFPLPINMIGEGLDVGDERRLNFEYKKWIFSNIHKGSTVFRVAESNANYIRFEIPHDDSYISNYLTWKSSEVFLEPFDEGKTKITWRLSYERKLDPYWYFGPMQSYATWLTARVLTENAINRN